jgi:hypothetical protein
MRVRAPVPSRSVDGLDGLMCLAVHADECRPHCGETVVLFEQAATHCGASCWPKQTLVS